MMQDKYTYSQGKLLYLKKTRPLTPMPVLQICTALLGILISLLCLYLLFRKSGDNKRFMRTLLIMFLTVLVINSLADGFVIYQISEGERNLFSIIVLAIFHSLELFFFNTYFFDNGYQEYFFGTFSGEPGHPWAAFLFAITFLLACFVSTSMIIRAFTRRHAGRRWLAENKTKAGHSHLFFLGGEVPQVIAKSIKEAHPDHKCIFIGYPDPEEHTLGLSIWERIQRFLSDREESNKGNFDAVVYSRIELSETNGVDICQKMDLLDLDAYLKDKSCKVYLLSDDDKKNLHCTEILHKYLSQSDESAEIFCRTCREGINRMYENALANTPNMNIHLVDTAGLAIQTIKNKTELLPVSFVRKGVNGNGQPEGWVDSPFEAMVLGFGETGQEMLGFLYEYGAFVGKDFKKSPFRCTVLDRQMDQLEQSFRNRHRAMDEQAGIFFKQCSVGSNAFWEILEERLPSLNYIAICLDDDSLNLRIAFDLVEYAYRSGKDLSKDFIILANQEVPTYLDTTTLKHYESIRQYQACIHTFGNWNEVWTYDHITGESIRNKAKRYYDGYNKASGDQGDWEARDRKILTTTDFELFSKRVRQRSQDYANCMHALTKLALTDPALLDSRKEIAADIPSKYDEAGMHYTGKDPHIKTMLDYLAVQEHLRWEASHAAMGYVPGEKTDDIKKIQENMKPFDELSSQMKHYDYLVVKATFELY